MPINFELEPDLIKTSRQVFKESHYGGAKYYRAKWVQHNFVALSRVTFRRASEAETYGQRVVERLRRLKAAAIVMEPTI